MNKKIPISLVIALVLVAMTVTFSVTMIVAMQMFDKTVSSVKEKEILYNKIAEIDKISRASFYGEINDTYMYDTIAAGYIAGLADKNSKYYTASKLTEMLDLTSGRLMGIGIETVGDSTGYSKVIKVYEGSPAAEAGIEKGAHITRITTEKGETDVKLISDDALTTLLQGEAGTTVTLTYTSLTGEEHTLEIMRRSFEIKTVDYQIADAIGYVKISLFNDNTRAELDYALNQIRDAGCTSIVFDVRNNAGGTLKAATDCIDLICPTGNIASAEYKGGNVVNLADSDANAVDLPMVVLINGSTASSAELFAVSLRDMSDAHLVGTKTAGKGTIQELNRLTDGSAVDITVAKLLPGNSESFDGVGVLPDYELALKAEEEQYFYDFTLESDPQIIRAFEIARELSKTTAQNTDTAQDTETQEGTQEEAPAEGEAPTESAAQ
ncbi:MAG: S41 family peptidase [Oscillospiraceae bacterium]|nr:S41 family peptidase [Oscillospiraceae bacterium]